jgi:transposase
MRPVSKRVVYLTDEQWKKIEPEPLIPKRPKNPGEGGLRWMIGWYSKVYSGYSRQEPDGKTSPASISILQHAGVDWDKGINLLVPHRKNHRNVNRQDDRLWDRYRRRYTVEQTFSWITNYRPIVVRYENHINMFVAFFQMACIMATLKKCL